MSERKPGWRELPRGAVSTKSSKDYKTGDWGITKPEFDRDKCTKCTLCHFYCCLLYTSPSPRDKS